MSIEEWGQLSPKELQYALDDHDKYHYRYDKCLVEISRYIGVANWNKGVKPGHQIRDVKKFYPLWWEAEKSIEIPTQAKWKELDRKYTKKA